MSGDVERNVCVEWRGALFGPAVAAEAVCWGWMGPVRGLRRACWCVAGLEQEKGIWWMPWRQEAMKDVARCENLGGAASRL